MHETRGTKLKYRSSTHYILMGLVPYTEANTSLVFKPNKFFDDLEKLDEARFNKKSLKSNYYRLIRTGMIEINQGRPALSDKAYRKLEVKQFDKLDKNKKILVTFDVPEKERDKRDALRLLLKELYFKPVQLSVWESEYECRKYLKSEIHRFGLEKYVSVYETVKIKI